MSFLVRALAKLAKVDPTDFLNQQTTGDIIKMIAEVLS